MPITSDILISEEDNIWLGYFSNDMFKLEGGDKVDITLECGARVFVKKTGVHMLWDKYVDEKLIEYNVVANEDAAVLSIDDNVSMDQAGVRPKRDLDQYDAGPSHGGYDEDYPLKGVKNGPEIE
ncbi:hypothetical protein TIFTF001_035292 [Ficus carica]|uniref:Uncharacterized protein n=1 Tax=Ficus carica TaxID=3494 RepID=A0AA88E1Z2_FICCA|nr:hypothetical protein TIFTF001_035292 [Ficus carica]